MWRIPTGFREYWWNELSSSLLRLLKVVKSKACSKGCQLVSENDAAIALDFVRAESAGPVEGIFGPASLTWRIDREAIVFLGAGRALLLQLAHPWVAAAIAEHSRTLSDPIGRFQRTFNTTLTLMFGTTTQAIAAARRLHRRHAGICGALTESSGPYSVGSAYRANDVAALRW